MKRLCILFTGGNCAQERSLSRERAKSSLVMAQRHADASCSSFCSLSGRFPFATSAFVSYGAAVGLCCVCKGRADRRHSHQKLQRQVFPIRFVLNLYAFNKLFIILEARNKGFDLNGLNLTVHSSYCSQ